MAKYKKADDCGPVAYPDQSGRYLGEGEVVEDDEANDWAPLVALGFIEEVGGSVAVTADKQESPEELKNAVSVPETKPKKKKSRKKSTKATEEKPSEEKVEASTSEREVSDVMRSADDGAGAEEVDSSEAGKSDS